MRVVFYTNNISPHQLPLAREVMRLVGRENFLYVGEAIAWRGKVIDAGEVRTAARADEGAQEWLENAEVMYTGGLRPIGLLEQRAKRGLRTFYYSERWFKPVVGFRCQVLGVRIELAIPGWVRLVVPRYRRMAKQFVRLANENACVTFLPTGPWAKRDFIKMGVRPDKFLDWGYFVEPSTLNPQPSTRPFRVLWVGRKVGWKREGDIAKAVALVSGKCPVTYTCLTGASMEEVRQAMRTHDLYVLASDENEGWGAALNEALEEGMNALGTFEAGASAAMLPQERLYHAGDWRALARLIEREIRGELPPCSIGDWTAAAGADRLLGHVMV